jgi:hypothetical protein
VLDTGQQGRERVQSSGMNLGVNPRRGKSALKPRKNFSVETAAVQLGACLEPVVQVYRNILERKSEHRKPFGTETEPFWSNAVLPIISTGGLRPQAVRGFWHPPANNHKHSFLKIGYPRALQAFYDVKLDTRSTRVTALCAGSDSQPLGA